MALQPWPPLKPTTLLLCCALFLWTSDTALAAAARLPMQLAYPGPVIGAPAETALATSWQLAAPVATSAALPPAPFLEEPIPHPRCPDIISDVFFTGCPISLDRISMTYSRGSDEQLTAEMIAAMARELNNAGLPVPRCCATLELAAASNCTCAGEPMDELAIHLEQQGVATLAFVQSALAIVQDGCDTPVLPCPGQAG